MPQNNDNPEPTMPVLACTVYETRRKEANDGKVPVLVGPISVPNHTPGPRVRIVVTDQAGVEGTPRLCLRCCQIYIEEMMVMGNEDGSDAG